MANLIREDDTAVYGDKGYASDAKKRAAQEAGVLWAVKEKAKPGRELTKRQRARATASPVRPNTSPNRQESPSEPMTSGANSCPSTNSFRRTVGSLIM